MAKIMGLDVSAFFRMRYGILSAFEQKMNIRMPEDIVAFLAA